VIVRGSNDLRSLNALELEQFCDLFCQRRLATISELYIRGVCAVLSLFKFHNALPVEVNEVEVPFVIVIDFVNVGREKITRVRSDLVIYELGR